MKECRWSFIQALANPPLDRNQTPPPAVAAAAEEEEVYVHPLVKRSASSLSTKSLEMCTESLGSETGLDISESIDEFPFPSPEKDHSPAAAVNTAVSYKYREPFSFSKKSNRTGIFPPPLTSISGCDGVKVRPRREGGRLVITAVNVTAYSSFFQAERSEGRLRLSLRKTEDKVLETEETEEDEDVASQPDIYDVDDDENDDATDEVIPITIPTSRCKESESRNKQIQSWYCVAIS